MLITPQNSFKREYSVVEGTLERPRFQYHLSICQLGNLRPVIDTLPL